jgi:Rnl2 family RNA ligase
LPHIENNEAEGVVIKPNIAKWFKSGERVIFKHKTDAFNEKSKKPSGPKLQKPPTQLSKEAEDLLEEFQSLITTSRLDNVISKIGQVTISDTSTMISAYTKDVMDEFRKDYGEEFDKLKTEEQKVFTKYVISYINFLTIL